MDLRSVVTFEIVFTDKCYLCLGFYSIRKAAGDECNDSDEELKRSKMVCCQYLTLRVPRIIYFFSFH